MRSKHHAAYYISLQPNSVEYVSLIYDSLCRDARIIRLKAAARECRQQV